VTPSGSGVAIDGDTIATGVFYGDGKVENSGCVEHSATGIGKL